MTPSDVVTLGVLLFPDMDQLDVTGPFEALARVPESRLLTIARTLEPVPDRLGLRLLPDTTMAIAPPLDLLLVPGGRGHEPLMDDAETLAFIRRQAGGARQVLAVGAGALLCAAAGLLRGRRATTQRAAMALLARFGAVPSLERVVVDGRYVCACDSAAAIEASQRIAARLHEPAANSLNLRV